MSGKKVLVVDWNGKPLEIKFRKGWKFSKLEAAIKEETDLSLLSDCYLDIGGETIDSSESFESVMNQKGKDASSVNAKLIVKSRQRKIECTFSFVDKSKSPIQMEHKFEEEFDFDIFWDELGRVWKDRDQLFSNVEISREMKHKQKENEIEPQENIASNAELKRIKGKSGFEDEMYEITDDPSNVHMFFKVKLANDLCDETKESVRNLEETVKARKEKMEKIKEIDDLFEVKENVNGNDASKYNLEQELAFLKNGMNDRVHLSQLLLKECKSDDISDGTQVISKILPSKNTIINICDRLDMLLEIFKKCGISDTNPNYGLVSEAKDLIKQSGIYIDSNNSWDDLDTLINDKWDVAGSRLKEALTDIQPFNINKMLKLHNKTWETSKTLKNKDIILCIGHTGAGKSTTIHFLAGSKMKKDSKTGHIYPSNVINDDLKEVKTDYRVTSSVTEYVSAVKIEEPIIAEVSTSPSDEKTSSIYLCDTPGFDDSSGSEVDVANGLGIVKAVSEAKCARILLVIGGGDCEKRFEGIKYLAHTLSLIFPNFYQSFGCICAIFTKFNKNKKQIIEDFKQGRRELGKKNEKDKSFLQLMERVSEMKEVIKLNPIKDNPHEILKFLSQKEKITSPEKEFKDFVSRKSLDRIKAQISRHKRSISSNLKCNNYDIIFSKLTQLQQLDKVIKVGHDNLVEECSAQVRQHWNQRMNETIEMLKASLNAQLDINKVTRETLMNNLKTYLQVARLHEREESTQLAKQFLGKNENDPLIPVEKLHQILEKQFDTVLKRYDEEVLKLKEGKEELNAQMAISCIAQTSSVVKILESKDTEELYNVAVFKNKLNKTIRASNRKIKECTMAAKKLIADKKSVHEFEVVYATMSRLGMLKSVDDAKIDGFENVTELCNVLEEKVMKHIAKHCKLINDMFAMSKKNDRVNRLDLNFYLNKTNDDIKQCKDSFEWLEVASQVFGVAKRGVSDVVYKRSDECFNESCNTLLKYFNQLSKMVSDIVNVKSKDINDNSEQIKRKRAKELVTQMKLIREMHDTIKTQTAEEYYSTLNSLVSYLDNIRTVFNETLSDIEKAGENNRNVNVNYKQLVEYMNILNECDWVFEFMQRGDSNQGKQAPNHIRNEIVEKLEQYIAGFENRARDVCITMKRNDDMTVQQTVTVIESAYKLIDLKLLVEDVEKRIDSIVNVIYEKINNELDTIGTCFDEMKSQHQPEKKSSTESTSTTFDATLTENAIIFMQKCEKIIKDTQKTSKKNKLEKRINVANATIDRYLQDFAAMETVNINEAINHLKQLKPNNNPFENGEVLNSRLRQLCLIYENGKYPAIVDYLSNSAKLSLNDIVNRIVVIYTKFEKTLKSSSDVVHIVLAHTKAMSRIDWFLSKYGENAAMQFNSLYDKYCQESFDLTSLENAIKNKNGVVVQNEMRRLSSMMKLNTTQNVAESNQISQTYETAQILLTQAMKTTATEALQLLAQMEHQINKEFDSNLTGLLRKSVAMMNDLQPCCDKYLTQENGTIAKNGLNQVTATLEQLMQHIEQVGEAGLKSNNFSIVESQLSKCNQLNTLFNNKLEFGNELRAKLNVKINKLEKRLPKMPLNGDNHKTLYESLEKVSEIDVKYRVLLNKVKRDLIDKFERQLEQAEEAEYDESERMMEQLKEIFESFPTARSHLQGKYNSTRKKLDNEKFRQDLNKWIENRQFDKLNSLYFDTVNRRDKKKMEKFETCLERELENLKYKMKDFMQIALSNKQDIEMVRKNVFDGWTVFVKLCQFVANFGYNEEEKRRTVNKYDYIVNNIRDVLIDYLRQRCHKINRYIGASPLTNQNSNCLDVESSVVAVLSLELKATQESMLKDSDRTLTVMERIFQTMKDAIDKLFQECREFFGEQKEKFEKGLELLNSQFLLDSIETMRSFGRKKCLLLKNMIDFGFKNDEKEYLVEHRVMIDKVKQRLRDAMSTITEKGVGNKDVLLAVESSNDFYKDIKYTLHQLQDCDKKLFKYLGKNDKQRGHYFDVCLKKLTVDVETIYNTCKKLIRGWGNIERKDSNIANEQLYLQDIHLYYWQLVCIDKLSVLREFNPTEDQVGEWAKNIRNTMKSKIEMIKSVFKNEAIERKNNFRCMVKCLIELEMVRTMFEEFSEEILNDMTDCLDYFKDTNDGLVTEALMKLVNALEREDSHWGVTVCANHRAFKMVEIARFNGICSKQYISRSIDSVLQGLLKENVGSSEIDKGKLIKHYKLFEKRYNALLKQYFDDKKQVDLILNCRTQAHNTINTAKPTSTQPLPWWVPFWGTKTWDGFHDCVVELVAYVSAIWTSEYAKEHVNLLNKHNMEEYMQYLMKPRPSQIISIFILLNLDRSYAKFENNLIQIGTGEGKSVTLGIAACVLGLLEYDVYCACYSKYLSDRDCGDFETIFKLLGIESRVHYGTFNQLCEDIINSEGNVRELIENAILQPKTQKAIVQAEMKKDDTSAREKILLIDEVDVFFSEKFYGNVYTPGAVLRHERIKDLIDLIWNDYSQNGQGNLTLYEIKQRKEYHNLTKKFGQKWMKLIDESIKQMLVDIDTFESCNHYEIVNDKIGYKDNDGINTSAMIGYKTLFSYYKENKNNEITNSSLNDKIGIYLKCGSFSYADIVHDHFKHKVGVSGTLKTLSKLQKHVIRENYNIKRFTIMPSLFPSKVCVFDQQTGVKLCDEDNKYGASGDDGKENVTHDDSVAIGNAVPDSNFYSAIMNEIFRGQKSNTGDTLRPVFIVFEDLNSLEKFYHDACFRKERSNALIISEKTSKDKRNLNVRLATTAGKIVLFTKEFGRGTDFQVRDKYVDTMGGPHIIQTFLSLEQSEEKQIQGRTARQGGNGTYVMVLPASQIDKIDEAKTQLSHGKLYAYLNEKREKKFEKRYKANEYFVQNSKTRHKKALELQRWLISGNIDNALKTLISENRGPPMKRQKLPILVDSTGSMGELLLKTKNIIGDVFERCGKILIGAGQDPECFEIFFIGYRNYNAPPGDSLVNSGWCAKAYQLRDFLSRVQPAYGWQNEAIELALYFAKKEHGKLGKNGFKQMIIIGDAGANTRDEVKHKRAKSHHAQIWNQSNELIYNREMYWEDELEYFRNKGIKINSLYLKSRAKKDFETIAQRTGGEYSMLDMNDIETSTQTLTDFICSKILFVTAGEEAVEEYYRQYVQVK